MSDLVNFYADNAQLLMEKTIAHLGNDDWPLPIPLVRTASGPNRATSRAVTPCERTATVSVQGRKAAPVCRAL